MKSHIRLGGFAIFLALLNAGPVSAETGGVVHIELPATGVTLHERPDDRLRVTSYELYHGVYLRGKGSDVFTKRTQYYGLTVSPRGDRIAGLSEEYAADGRDEVVLLDRGTWAEKRVKTVRGPWITDWLRWSPDGRYLVGTERKKLTDTKWAVSGFSIVDPKKLTYRQAKVTDPNPEAYFEWTPGARSVISWQDGEIKEYWLDGRLRRSLKVGNTPNGEYAFSPSGRRLLTWCPYEDDPEVCVVRWPEGKITKKVNFPAESLLGWWDERHFIAVAGKGRDFQVVVAGLDGKPVRVLADLDEKAWKIASVYLLYTRA
ncbi:hypothetical protein [Spongiactinospora sp. 9N601]|uniref:hypothetical protein n=1 Tax=Spongiactinospora sp. 9N601 TaxID=3375149 RepID=UPI0037875070